MKNIFTKIRFLTLGLLVAASFSACNSADEVSVDLPLVPPLKSEAADTQNAPPAKTDQKSDFHNPTVEVKNISEVTPEEWDGVINAIINTKTKLLLENQIYIITNKNGVFPFWENNKRLISLGFPHGEQLDKNPFLLKYLREFPSSMKENDFSLLEDSPYSTEKKAELQAYRAKIEAVLPFVITDSIGDFAFLQVEAAHESGKYVATYRNGETEYAINIYDILSYKDGSYDDINPEDIFGTERMPKIGSYVYHDEFSLFWRNQNHMFDIDVSSENASVEAVTPLAGAYLERFPSEKF